MRLIQRDGRRLSPPRLVRAEEVPFQMSERRMIVADKVYHFTLAAILLCHALQAPPLLHAVAEQLRVAVVPQQRHRHAVRLPQHPGDDVLLHPVEVGEPVDVHILARQIAGLRQRVAQLLHPRPGIPPAAVEPGVIGAEQQRRGAQLLPRRAGDGLYLLHQLLRRDTVGVQLVRQRHQLPQERRTLGRSGEHRQVRRHLLQGAPHGQYFPAVVQRHLRQAAGLRQHPRSQTLKAQHLPVTAGGIAQRPAEIQLRLVGGVLRHQQHLSAPLPPRRHRLQHPPALARTGPAGDDPQLHHVTSCRFLIVYRKARPKGSMRRKKGRQSRPFFTDAIAVPAADDPGFPP